VGTAAGDLIPIAAEQGGGFVKDDLGAYVKSRLDEASLKAIAAAAGGLYVPLGTQGEGLDIIFKSALGSAAKHDLAFRQQKIYTQRYQWPLSASLGMLLASLLIGTRRRGGGLRAGTAAVAVISSSLLLMLATSHAADAASVSPQDAYNAGTHEYRAGQFPQAAQSFQQSISNTPSSDAQRLADQQDAYYNLGNTLYRDGQKTEKTAPQDSIKTWTQAVKAYETALQLKPNDADSKFNRDLVQRKINALQQQQNQNQNQNQNQQNKGSGQQQGQPPTPPKDGSGKDQKDQDPKDKGPQQGQPPPQPQPGDSKGNPPPPGAGQPPPGAGQPPPGAQPPPKPGESKGDQSKGDQQPTNAGQPPRAEDDTKSADNQRVPGQMSREEARELLDSAKGEERHALGVPMGPQDPKESPDKPFKNW
jgi:Ca-activated chloride channel family protein